MRISWPAKGSDAAEFSFSGAIGHPARNGIKRHRSGICRDKGVKPHDRRIQTLRRVGRLYGIYAAPARNAAHKSTISRISGVGAVQSALDSEAFPAISQPG